VTQNVNSQKPIDVGRDHARVTRAVQRATAGAAEAAKASRASRKPKSKRTRSR
jgi:hypothetical protein